VGQCDIYEDELGNIRLGQKAAITLSYYLQSLTESFLIAPVLDEKRAP
jgi:hypothetical protein